MTARSPLGLLTDGIHDRRVAFEPGGEVPSDVIE
jgi:hypothetical protein